MQVHKSSEAAKNATKEARSLKQKIKMLDEEKDKLGDKVERAKNQASAVQQQHAPLVQGQPYLLCT